MDKILILGGTNFIGRNLITELIKLNQFDITIFNRGVTNPELFPEIKKIIGDRNTSDIEKIKNNNWDYIIDLSCYYPNSIEKILKLIKNNIKKYIFISTCSVYGEAADSKGLISEKVQILDCTAQQRMDNSPSSYGNRKAACEQLIKKHCTNYIILRPALVYGPYDHSDRFYYWLYQIKNNNLLLIPDNGERLFSCTYVTDLVHCIIQSIKNNNGIYNIISQPKLSIKEIIKTGFDELKTKRNKIIASPAFLHKNGIQQWTDMPLWIDHDRFTFSNKKMLEDFNLVPTNFRENLSKTVAYYNSISWPTPRYGISEIRRQALIRKIGT